LLTMRRQKRGNGPLKDGRLSEAPMTESTSRFECWEIRPGESGRLSAGRWGEKKTLVPDQGIVWARQRASLVCGRGRASRGVSGSRSDNRRRERAWAVSADETNDRDQTKSIGDVSLIRDLTLGSN